MRGLDAVDTVAEADVHQDQVRTQLAGLLYGFVAVLGDADYVIAQPTQSHAQGARDRALIFDNKDVCSRHVRCHRHCCPAD